MIIKHSFTIHFVVFPLTIIHTSILIEKFALTMSHVLKFVAFVSAANRKSFNNILYIIHLVLWIRYLHFDGLSLLFLDFLLYSLFLNKIIDNDWSEISLISYRFGIFDIVVESFWFLLWLIANFWLMSRLFYLWFFTIRLNKHNLFNLFWRNCIVEQ